MAIPGIVGAAAIGGAASGLIGGLNFFSQKQTQKTNLRLQREAWAREDNAVQRKVADLKAAGMNPVLAAGQAAQAGAPIKQNEATFDTNPVADALTAAQVLQQKEDISKTKAEADYIRLQSKHQNMENQMFKSMIDLKIQDLRQRVMHDAAMNPHRINQIVADISHTNVAAEQKRLDNKLHRLREQGLTHDVAIKDLTRMIMREHGMAKAKAEIAAKRIATSIAEHDYRWYKKMDLPSGASIGWKQSAVQSLFGYGRQGIEYYGGNRAKSIIKGAALGGIGR